MSSTNEHGSAMDDEMSNQASLLVSIVTHNSADVIEECLSNFRYLAAIEGVSAELIVADNASTDGTDGIVNRFIEKHAGLPYRLASSSTNRGWGGGNNLAISSASQPPDLVLLCNPDASIDELNLRALVKALMSGPPEVAIAVPYVENETARVLAASPEWSALKYTVWDLASNKYPYRRFQRRYQKPRGTFVIKSGYASGALALFKFEALRRAGFFDERIFLFHDDIDVSRTIQEQGGLIVGTSDAIGRHRGGKGSKIVQPVDGEVTPAMLAAESELVFVEKWHGDRAAVLLAHYRVHAFFRIQKLLRRAAGRPPVDAEPFRQRAREYLARRRH